MECGGLVYPEPRRAAALTVLAQIQSLDEHRESPNSKLLVFRRHAQIVKNKRIYIPSLLQPLSSAASRMSRIRINPNQYRILMAGRSLQSRRIFKRMTRHNAVVMVRGSDQRSRIFHASADVVQR